MRNRIHLALVAALAVGCSAKTLPTQSPIAVSPLQFQSGEVRVPDQVIVVTDSSGTMYDNETFPLAKALTRTFVAAMPDGDTASRSSLGYEAGLVGFGGDERIRAGLAPFDRGNLSSKASVLRPLGEVGGFGGRTPYHAVLAESQVELAGKSGVAALVIFSDGLPDDEMDALRAAKALVESRNGNVCIHTVQTGDDPAGASLLSRLSRLSSCGSHRSAASVGNPSAFGQFAHDVFAGKGPLLTDTIRQHAQQAAPQARLVLSEFEPVIVAWLIAYEAGGGKVGDAVYKTLRDTMPPDLKRKE